jgi:hypothetical protein
MKGTKEIGPSNQALLAEWKLLVDGENPIARTNVAPIVGAPAEPSLPPSLRSAS